ncbi:hypothetical protein NPX79_01575 [Spiroplasma endosymbiont of Anurida maritima]|uniref:hypothetical protein n=1 Tax=Spiroplasma endosymbiont of Anurida maritima TaxID=2967972 RepID=UPI0036D43693
MIFVVKKTAKPTKKDYLYPIYLVFLYVGYVMVRQAILRTTLINASLYNYTSVSDTYYQPYFFFDYNIVINWVFYLPALIFLYSTVNYFVWKRITYIEGVKSHS